MVLIGSVHTMSTLMRFRMKMPYKNALARTLQQRQAYLCGSSKRFRDSEHDAGGGGVGQEW